MSSAVSEWSQRELITQPPKTGKTETGEGEEEEGEGEEWDGEKGEGEAEEGGAGGAEEEEEEEEEGRRRRTNLLYCSHPRTDQDVNFSFSAVPIGSTPDPSSTVTHGSL